MEVHSNFDCFQIIVSERDENHFVFSQKMRSYPIIAFERIQNYHNFSSTT